MCPTPVPKYDGISLWKEDARGVHRRLYDREHDIHFACALSALNQGTPCPPLSGFLRNLEFREGICWFPRNADKILGHCSCCSCYCIEL